MTSAQSGGPVWGRFSQDPRDPGAARLRASDQDREIVNAVLGEAYADGRLDADEHADRSESANSAKLLADLPPLIDDLVPRVERPSDDVTVMSADDIDSRARREWQSKFSAALLGMLIPTLICVVVWGMSGMGYPWPVWVALGTGIGLIRVTVARPQIIAHERSRLERKQRKAIDKRDRKPFKRWDPPN